MDVQPMTPNELRPMRSLCAARPPLHYRGLSRVSEIARPEGRSIAANNLAAFLAESKSCSFRFFGKMLSELDHEASESSTRLIFPEDINGTTKTPSPTRLPENQSDIREVAPSQNLNDAICETPRRMSQTDAESLSEDLEDIRNVKDHAKQLTFPT